MRNHPLKSRIARIRQWVKKFIYEPGLSEKELMTKETLFYWAFFTFVGNLGSLILTTILDAYPMIVFAYIASAVLIVSLYLYGTKGDFLTKVSLELYGMILIVLIISGWMGGPLDSGGLIFVGIYCIVMSAPMQNMKLSLGLTAFYFIGLITLVILDPFLDVHPRMTPQSNYIMFLVKLSWLTGAQIIFLGLYIKESSLYEERENTRLEELAKTKNRLFTNISHEIRTPITLMLGSADLIPPDQGNTRKAIHTIKSNGKRLIRLVNQMLSLAKLESGNTVLQNVQSDVIHFVEFIVRTFQSLADSKDIQLGFHAFSDAFTMDFDPDKIEEIISNLITNAIKYTQNGGKVRIEIQELVQKTVTRDKYIQISVRDNGKGVPQDQLDLIFDRFYQVNKAQKQHQEGSGIGLTLVRENVKLMGGTVEVESTEGIGTRFLITLPVRNQAPVQGELLPAMETSYPDNPDHRVSAQGDHSFEKPVNHDLPLLLVVEDHAEMVDYIQTLLEGEYRIISAANGFAGLDLAMESIPDIIISDVMMPEMDGFEFLGKLKNDIRTSHIPVIMLTAKADMPSKLEGLEAGAEAYLTKPFDRHELKVRLRSILDQRERLQKKYLTSILSDHIPDLNKSESAFKQQLHEILLANLDNPEFHTDHLARQIGMSRTQLYKKVKALTDTTVDKYIRKFRLHQSVQLLKSTDLSVSQVALEVGIPNHSSFSRAFRDEFGHSPSEVSAIS